MSKILIVDDEKAICTLCEKAFSEAGHEVICLNTSTLVFDVLGRQTIDAIVMDVRMEDEEEGLFLLKGVLKSGNKKIPVVIYSGAVTPELEKRAFELGAMDVVRKGTIGLFDLVGRVERVMEYNQMPEAARSARSDKLLIVDDDPSILKLLKEFFVRKNFQVVTAGGGKEALLVFQQEEPKLVLLDVRMPEMDGLETLRKLKQVRPDMGVVMISGFQDEETADEAVRFGAYAYVLKPFDWDYLETVVLTRLLMAS